MKKFLHLLDALLAGIIVVVIVETGCLDYLDYKVSDWLYQKAGDKSPDIVVIGIDSVTLDKLGPWQSWIRKNAAKAIAYLNSNPDSRPAVIGLDFVFNGNHPDEPEVDNQLAASAAQYGNVVVASAVIADNNLIDKNDPYALWSKTWAWDAPFSALAVATDTGHVCEPNEPDGILRHQLLYVNVTERGRLKSFARVLYEKWCHVKGIAPNPYPETAGNGLYYLPFTAKNYGEGLSFVDLLEGKIDADFFRGKIVLIGPYTSGMGDEFTTALDRSAPVYGVDVHANAIQAFQRDFFPREMEHSVQLIILFVISFIAERIFRIGKMQHSTAAALLICLGWFGICQICYQHKIILHTVWVPLAVSFLFVGAVATNYIYARAEKEQVTDTFGRYVDPTIMRQLLEGGKETRYVGGKLLNIAVLFVDIRGFTTMSEKLPPDTVVAILNQYLTLTSECIRRHNGTLDKFIGDCTMAFWNAPLTQEQPVLLACRAALDMIKGSEKLKSELKKRYGHEISFGIGIHWGNAVVGNIGSPLRMDYTAIGDTVNTAARLEANAPGGKIFISRDVADILGSRADVTSLGDTVKLKGKTDGFEVLILNSLKVEEE